MFFCSQQALVELAPDLRYRVDHFETRGRAFLTQVAQVGTREGGAFETPFLVVGTVDARGLLREYVLYDLDQIDAARTRFEELARARPPIRSRRSRRATRRPRRWIAGAGVDDRDWKALRAICAPGT